MSSFSGYLNVRFRKKRTISPYLRLATTSACRRPDSMLGKLDIEALLIDEDLADKVWELWNAGLIPDEAAT